MKYLLDTHTFIWWVSSPEKLSENALAAYENRENSLFLSFASIWEMQIKVQIGKLRLPLHLKELIEEQKSVNDLRILPISVDRKVSGGVQKLYFCTGQPGDAAVQKYSFRTPGQP